MALSALTLLALATACRAGLPSARDGCPPVWNEDHLVAFLGGWKDPARMAVAADGAGDRKAAAALKGYIDNGLAFLRLFVYVDEPTTVAPGDIAATIGSKTYNDSGVMLARDRALVPGKCRLTPHSKQPIELIVVLPRECSVGWVSVIYRPNHGGGE